MTDFPPGRPLRFSIVNHSTSIRPSPGGWTMRPLQTADPRDIVSSHRMNKKYTGSKVPYVNVEREEDTF